MEGLIFRAESSGDRRTFSRSRGTGEERRRDDSDPEHRNQSGRRGRDVDRRPGGGPTARTRLRQRTYRGKPRRRNSRSSHKIIFGSAQKKTRRINPALTSVAKISWLATDRARDRRRTPSQYLRRRS